MLVRRCSSALLSGWRAASLSAFASSTACLRICPSRSRSRVFHSAAQYLAAEAAVSASPSSAPSVTSRTAAAVRSSPPSPPFRTVLFASSDFSLPTLRALCAGGSGADLVSGPLVVVTPPDKKRGRGSAVSASVFKAEALRLGCRVVDLPQQLGFKMEDWDLPADIIDSVDAGIVVSFGYMLPVRLIARFPAGVLNVHPSLLPAFRGAAPIQFAIAHAQETTGVSIIDVHPTRIDGGDILSQETTPLPATATFASMSPQLAEQGARQLVEVLRDLPTARTRSRSQQEIAPAASAPTTADLSSALSPSSSLTPSIRSAPRIPKSAGQLLFTLHAPGTLYRVWAACHGFLPVWSTFRGERVAIMDVLHPDQASTVLAQAAQGLLPTPADASFFPTAAEAHALGAGGLFFEPHLHAIGVVCAGSSLAHPRVLYVRELQLANKASPVNAVTFAHGYMDKRKVKAALHCTWKFVSSEEGPAGGKTLQEVDWWGPRIGASEATAQKLKP